MRMEGLRFPELLVILLLIAVLFGPKKIAGLGAGLGKSIRGFKDAMEGKEGDEQKAGAQAKASAPDELPGKQAAGESPGPGTAVRTTEQGPAAKER